MLLTRKSSGLGGIFSSASFSAPLTSSVALEIGPCSSLFTRTSVATVIDHERTPKNCLSGEVRFTGARRVQNLVASSENLQGAGWTPGATGTITGPNTISLPADGDYVAALVNSSLLPGDTYVGRIKLSGTGTVRIRMRRNGAGAYEDTTTSPLTLSATPQVFSVSRTFANAHTGVTLDVYRNASTATAVTVTEAQIERLPGRTNYNPSEYVSSGAARANEVTYTEEIDNAAWTKQFCTITANAVVAPNGAMIADKIVEDNTNNWHGASQNGTAPAGVVVTLSVYLKAAERTWARIRIGSGVYQQTFVDLANGTLGTALFGGVGSGILGRTITPVGDGWYRCTITGTSDTVVNARVFTAIADATDGHLGDGVSGIYVWGFQLERASAPTGYFPVGNVYPFHGACVDGVKYFEYENGNTVANNIVTEAVGAAISQTRNHVAYLPGTAGSYFSTTDPAVRIFGSTDLDIRLHVCPDDWTPTALQILLAKWNSGVPSLQYIFYLDPAGTLTYIWSSNGLVLNTITTSTAAVSAVNGEKKWVRLTHDVDNGAGGNDVKFWTSDDGIVWTQLGNTVTNVGATTIADTERPVWIGAHDSAAANTFNGAVYRAQVRRGIDGDLAVDFNPAEYGNGWTSSATGGEWEMNGGAIVHNSFLKGYLSEGASSLALVALDASSFSAGWTDVGTPTRVANPLRCGDWRLDELGDDAAGALEGKLRAVAFTGDGVKSISLLWKAGTSTSTLVRVLDTTGAANRLLATIVPVAGFPIIVPTTGTEERPPEPLGNGVYRLFFATTAITAVNNNQLELYPASDAALAVAPTGTVYLGGVQCENQTFASSLSTAARAADVLDYRGAYIPGEGTLYVEVVRETLANSTNGRAFCISDGTGNEKVEVMHSAGAATGSLQIMDGGVQQVPFIQVQAFLAKSVAKYAARFATNNSQIAINGEVTAADTVCTMPTTNEVEVGQISASNHINGHVRNARILPAILNDAALQALTRQSTIPLPIMDGLQGWFVKGKGVTQTGAGASQWADYSGKGHHLLQAANTNRPRYATSNALMCPGVAGAYATTPDSAALSFTGDAEWEFEVAPDTLTADNYFGNKTNNIIASGWRILFVSSGALRLQWGDGSLRAATSTVVWPYAAGVRSFGKIALDVDNGAGGCTIRFWHKAASGDPWTQLGATVTGAFTTSVVDNAIALQVGSGSFGGAGDFSGEVFRFILRNGIDGTTVVDFNPADTTDGDTSFPSLTTGETWTVNGTAYLYGNPGAMLFDGVDNVLKCAAFTFFQPETVYTLFKQVTWTLNDIIHDGDASGTLYLYQSAAQPNIRINAGAVTTANTNLAMNTYGVVASVFNGASSLTQVNDTTPATGDCGAGNAGGFTLGASGAAGSFSNIQVEAVLVFSGAHDAAQRAAVYNHLRNFHTPGTP